MSSLLLNLLAVVGPVALVVFLYANTRADLGHCVSATGDFTYAGE